MSARGERSGTIEYQPALDGVRALAVVAVLLFHAEVPGFSGGYLGVSVFFTLSGYLITSLLLAEHRSTGAINMPAFYARRVRRLLPASLACILAIVVLSELTDLFSGVTQLRREVLGALLQVSNWVFLAGEGSYQQLFEQASGARSPVEHFWSLSIEEQFYWLWPPTMALLLGRLRSHRRRTIALAVLTAVFAAAAPLTAWWFGSDAAYWATPARIGEILVGALLAMVLGNARRLPPAVAWLAPAALAALSVCVVLFPAAGGPAYNGWLPVVAVGSAALVLGLQVGSPMRDVLSTRPFVWLGNISYGVYVYHWPIYLIADAERTGLDGWQLVGVQIALTLVLAQVSYAVLEHPIRRRRTASRRLTLASGGIATAAVATAAVLIVPSALGDYWRTDEALAEAAAIEVDDEPLEPLQPATTTTATPATTVPSPVGEPPASTSSTSSTTTSTTEAPLPSLSRPVRIVVAGDSTAAATSTGLVEWAAANPALAQVEVVAEPGCGFVRGGERLESGWRQPPEACEPWLGRVLPDRVAATQPDVVMLMVTTWDVLDHRWGGGELTPLDPEFAERIEADYRDLTQRLLEAGAGSIAWVAPPLPRLPFNPDGTGQEDPARHAAVRAVAEMLADEQPGEFAVVDLAAWLEAEGLSEAREVRPDGVHFDPAASRDVAERYLGERLIRVALA